MHWLFLVLLSFFAVSCSCENNHSASFPKEALSEETKSVADALEAIGIDTPEKVYTAFTSVGDFNRLLEQLQKKDPAIDSGNLVHFLKEIELRDMLDSSGLAPLLVDRLVATGQSLGRFKEQTAPLATAPSFSLLHHRLYLSGNANTADELKKADQYESLNNLFAEFSFDRLTKEDFNALRESLAQTSERIPSQVLEGSNQKSREGRTNPDLPLPYEREDLPTADSPSTAAMQWTGNKFNNCLMVKEQLPLVISAEEKPPFAVNDSGNTSKRLFFINTNSLALITVRADASGGTFTLFNPGGTTLTDSQIAAEETKYFVLPVFRNNVCAPFAFTQNEHVTVTISSLTPPVDVDRSITGTGLDIQNLSLADRSSYGELPPLAYFTFFHTAATPGAMQNIYFAAQSSNSPYSLIIITPSGAAVPVAQNTAGSLAAEHGLHELLVVPAGTVVLAENSRDLTALNPAAALEKAAEVSVSVKIDMTPDQTKKFVLGILKTAAFSRDGEPDSEKRAEIKLNLHTNMAPRMSLGNKKLDEYFGSSGGTYYAWKCWMDNGKPAAVSAIEALFGAGGACGSHASGYGAIMDSCEQQLLISTPLCMPWYGAEVQKYYEDAVYQEIAENYEEAYQSWKNKVVQINAMTYPYGNLYNISDSEGFALHPVVPVDMPVFGVAKERLKEETAPLSFDYSAIERDKLDEDAMLFSAAEWIVNTAVAVATGDLYRLVCGSIGFLNDARSLERAAQDDSIGNANFRLNRASKKHLFYGLEDGLNHFSFSGPADAPAEYTSFDKGVMYADLACDIKQANNVLDAYYVYEDIRKIIDAETYDYQSIVDAMLENPALSAAQKEAITALFEMLKEGNLPESYEAQLLAKDILGMFPEGSQDVFGDIDTLNAGLKNIGGLGSMGKNLMTSQAYYYFNGYDHRKTLGAAAVGVVRSLPVTDMKIQLLKTVIHNPMEEPLAGIPSRAEFRINSRVGIIGDSTPAYRGISIKNAQSYDDVSGHLYTNGSSNPTIKGTPFRAYTKRKITSNTTISGNSSTSFELSAPEDPTLFDASFNTGSNMAAIYVEIGVYENDGDTIDDDMVGVYSKTFLLEDFFSQDVEHRWIPLGGNRYRLEVNGAYLYGAHQLATTVDITGSSKTKQAQHNINRLEKKNAEITFAIDIELGTITASPDFSFPLPELSEDSSFDLALLHPAIIETAETFEEALSLLDQQGGKVLVAEKRSAFAADPSTTRLFVFTFDTAAKTLVKTHELSAAHFPELAEGFTNKNFITAKFAKNGNMVVMLEKYQKKAATGRLAAFDISGTEAVLASAFEGIAAANPQTFAVDADGSTIYAATEDTMRDIVVLSLSDSGTFTALFDEKGVPFTVIHIEPLEAGHALVISKKEGESDLHFTIFEKQGSTLRVLSNLRNSRMQFHRSAPYPYRAHTNKFVIGGSAIEWDNTYFLQNPETNNTENVTGGLTNSAKGIRHPELPFYCSVDYMRSFYSAYGIMDNEFFCWLGNKAVTLGQTGLSMHAFRYIAANPRYIAAATFDNELVLIDLYGQENCPAADAGEDIIGSIEKTVTLNALLPEGLTGSWEIISGSGGILTGTFDPKTTFSGVRGESYLLRWTVADPFCGTMYDEVSVSFASGEPCPGNETVTYMGKTYHTVQIGNQCWFRENLDAGTVSATQTDNSIIEKSCPEEGCEGFGGLYAWYELVAYKLAKSDGINLDDPQGICPMGWHVPTSNEWLTLFDRYGGILKAGTALIQGGASGLEIKLFTNTNAVGTLYTGASYWSSTEYGSTAKAFPFTFYNGEQIEDDEHNKGFLKSARCILDEGSSGCIAAADAGPDQLEVQGTTVTLTANTPLEGSGEWQIQSGTGGSFADKTKANTLFTGTKGTSYVLQWVVTAPGNPACAEFITDTVNISFAAGGAFACGDILTDQRDSKSYKTVLLGGKCWMQESLNIGKKLIIDRDNSITQLVENNSEIEKYCYNNDESKCTEYGAFYIWNEAMNWSDAEGSQGICPAGWHLPSVAEFTALVKLYDAAADDASSSTAGDDLRNAALFAAKIGGDFIPSNYTPSSNENYETQFWTSSQSDASNAYRRMVYASNDFASGGTMAKDKGGYVRCVKN